MKRTIERYIRQSYSPDVIAGSPKLNLSALGVKYSDRGRGDKLWINGIAKDIKIVSSFQLRLSRLEIIM